MKLKILTASLFSLGMTACATQSMHNSQSGLDEKVYAGYEQLVGKQSYAFDAEMRLDIDPQSVAAKTVNPTVQAELDKLSQQRKLTTTERQWLYEGLEPTPNNQTMVRRELILALFNRGYLRADGVVDLQRGQLSINPKVGYAAKNAEAWLLFPLAVDVKQAKIYADLSAFSPVLTDPQYDGRYMLIDYAHYMQALKDHHVELKPVILFLKEYFLLNSLAIDSQQLQTQALTTADKQKGGVQRIVQHTDYKTLMQQDLLFLYLNEPYFLKYIQSFTAPGQLEALRADLKKTSQAVPSNPTTDTANTAKQATARLADAVNAIRSPYLGSLDTAPASDASKVKEDDLFLADQFILSKIDDDALKAQLRANLKAFDQYKTGQLITAKQVKKIVAEQADAYAKLGQATAELFKDDQSLLGSNPKVTTDMVLDAKGRFIRADTSFKFKGLSNYDLGEITGIFKLNLYDYGQAHVDSQALQQAVPYQQVLKEQLPSSKLNKMVKRDSKDLSLSENWTSEKRYQNLARSLLAKNLSKFEVYQTVLWYGALKEQEASLDVAQSQQLQQAVLFEALRCASEEGWSLTTEQKQQLQRFKQQQPSPKPLSSYTSYYVNSAVIPVFQEMDLQHSVRTLRQQGKTSAQIFAQVYQQIDRQKTLRKPSDKYNVMAIEFFNMLGQLAAQDLKNQKIDQKILQKINRDQLEDLDYGSYQEAYQLLLDHP